MKKILVTGAAGGLGKLVLKYLLSEGKYEITALDLKNKMSYKTLKKYHRRVNVIYGDVTDPILIDALVKEHDYIIHLASIKPSMSILKEKISTEIDYKGSENIIRAITFYNPKCFLIFPSTTNVYGKKNKPVSGNEKVSITNSNYYTKTKIDVEKLIKEKLANYVIYRVPTVLTRLDKEDFIYSTPLDDTCELITASDAAYALVKTIDFKKDVNKKVFNLGGGETCITTFRELIINILKIRGINFKYIWSLLFLEKDFYGYTFTDSEKLENILHYQSESIASYLMQMKRYSRDRKINKIFAKPFIYLLSKKVK